MYVSAGDLQWVKFEMSEETFAWNNGTPHSHQAHATKPCTIVKYKILFV